MIALAPTHRLDTRSTFAIGAFAFGSLAVLVDALITFQLLSIPGHHENHGPVRAVLDTFGLALGLGVVSALAIGVFAVLALAAVRARPPLALGASVVLGLAVAARFAVIVWNLRIS